MWSPESEPKYRDRVHAGEVLAAELAGLAGEDLLVLGIPRGGVPVARVVARALGAELGVCVARKLAAPGYPEVAIGAVTADGGVFVQEDSLRAFAVSPSQLEHELEVKQAEAAERRDALTGARPSAKGRTVVLVDDGLATGATMIAAARALRREGAGRIVAAVPVGAPDSCRALSREVDLLVCPSRPANFQAVGLHYGDFRPTSMDEVRAALGEN